MNHMTIKELYDWAKKQGIEDYDICLAGNDWGYGYINECDIEINHERKEITLY